MNNKIRNSIGNLKKDLSKPDNQLSGLLGITLDGEELVFVPSRPGFVYVRLMGNDRELVQAQNTKVSPVYNLPVLLERRGDRYVILGVDELRYSSWGSNTPFLPQHAAQHIFADNDGAGGDVVYRRHFCVLRLH